MNNKELALKYTHDLLIKMPAWEREATVRTPSELNCVATAAIVALYLFGEKDNGVAGPAGYSFGKFGHVPTSKVDLIISDVFNSLEKEKK